MVIVYSLAILKFLTFVINNKSLPWFKKCDINHIYNRLILIPSKLTKSLVIRRKSSFFVIGKIITRYTYPLMCYYFLVYCYGNHIL